MHNKYGNRFLPIKIFLGSPVTPTSTGFSTNQPTTEASISTQPSQEQPSRAVKKLPKSRSSTAKVNFNKLFKKIFFRSNDTSCGTMVRRGVIVLSHRTSVFYTRTMT